MRQGRIWAFLAIATICTSFAAASEPVLEPVPEGESAAVPSMGEATTCPGNFSLCKTCGRRGCRGCAAPGCGDCGACYGDCDAGCFNCYCRGSYKFPVPPLYTYHWPGLYSQKSMIEPWKPYRFPPLNAPSWDEPATSTAVHGPRVKQTSSTTVLDAASSATSEPLSARFKRLSE